jgi:hypothetical protein
MIRTVAMVVAGLSLATCLVAGILLFLGRVGAAEYRSILSAGSAGWFICVAILAFRKTSR